MVLCLAAFPAWAFAVESVEVKIPVSVELSGEIPEKDETYTVKILALNQAPMPENDAITITGKGSAAFLDIFCSTPGIYYYQISQQAGEHERGHYDSTVYYVKVTVSNEEGRGLGAAVAVYTDLEMTGKKYGEVTFLNVYDAVEKPLQTEESETAQSETEQINNMSNTSVKTGDDTNLLLYGILLGISAVVVCLLAGTNDRKRYNKKSE